MKTTKKLFALLLCVVMVAAFGTTAFAANLGTVNNTGTITIKNAVKDKTYRIYKIFDATYDDKTNAAAYYINETDELYSVINESGLFNLQKVATASTATNRYLVTKKSTTDETAALTFFKGLALTGMTADGTQKASEAVVIFTGLTYGYYYVASDLGATVTLSNVNASVTILDKNQKPGWGNSEDSDEKSGKFIRENGELVTESSVNIGDKISYEIYVNSAMDYDGSNKVTEYKIYDELGDAINVNFHSIKVYISDPDNPDNYKEITGGWIDGLDSDTTEVGTDAEYVEGVGHAIIENDEETSFDNCNWYVLNHILNDGRFYIHIKWVDADGNSRYVNKDGSPSKIKITYEGTLESDATMGTDATNNTNTAILQWTLENNNTGKDSSKTVKTKTYALHLFKQNGNATGNPALAGATFRLEDEDGNVIPLRKAMVSNIEFYLLASTNAENVGDIKWEGDEVTEFTTDSTGTIIIYGLKKGTYKLVETEAPAGFNQLTEPVVVTLNDNNCNASYRDYISTCKTAISNFKGTVLPETGGIGTMIFIVVGTLAVVGAGIFLVTNKRMSKEAD